MQGVELSLFVSRNYELKVQTLIWGCPSVILFDLSHCGFPILDYLKAGFSP